MKESIVFYVQYMIVAYLIVVFVLLISRALDVDIQNVASLKNIDDGELLYRVAWMILIGPLMEETIFRLWNSFKRVHSSISIFTISYVILTKLLPHDHNLYLGSIQSDYLEHFIIKAAISAIVASSVFLLKQDTLLKFSKRYGKSLILISVILFALIHITNVRCAWYIYPFMTVMCLPQFVLGISVTNLRLNISFLVGLLFHCTINIISVFLSDGGRIVEALRLAALG